VTELFRAVEMRCASGVHAIVLGQLFEFIARF